MRDKTIVLEDVKYRYMVYAECGEYGIFSHTVFYTETSRRETGRLYRRALSLLGINREPVIVDDPVVLFKIYCDIDFKTIVTLGDMIPQNILLEDEQLLMYYDIAKDRV